jgi:hypothetical protein
MTTDLEEKACPLRDAVEPEAAGVYFAQRRKWLRSELASRVE